MTMSTTASLESQPTKTSTKIVCARCVMDNIQDPDFQVDEKGVCCYCHQSDAQRDRLPKTLEESERRVANLVQKIKNAGKGKEYDCVLGISGGVDSSYTAHLAAVHQLRPLVVHLDNGWNSEIAVSNIKNLLDACKFDLYTIVIDWEEFRDLQRSFFKASVIDIELLTDHAMYAAIYQIARKESIAYSLVGCNSATETHLPATWNWYKNDLKNIRAIQRKFGSVPIKTLPTMSFWSRLIYDKFGGFCKPQAILEDTIYRRDQSIALLTEKYGYRSYGNKHFESVFTKFYQAYVLPEKFGIDKRKSHLSSMVCNGEVTRAEALAILESPPYNPDELRQDKAFVLKKLGFSEEEFAEIMKAPRVDHEFYPSHRPLFRKLKSVKDSLKIR